MKTVSREVVERLPITDRKPHLINFDGGYLGHHEPCDDPQHYNIRYRGPGDKDTVKTFEREAV
jgi:hypothetical protein